MEDITHRIAATEDLAAWTPILPTGEGTAASSTIAAALERTHVAGEPLEVRGRRGAAVRLGPEIAALVVDIVRVAGAGRPATLVPCDALLTCRQVAPILGVDQPYLHGVMASGELRTVEIGDEELVRYRDLVKFGETRHREGPVNACQTTEPATPGAKLSCRTYLLPTGEGNATAADAREALRRVHVEGEPLDIRGGCGATVRLEPEMAELVVDIVRLAGAGRAATIIPHDALLTITLAARVFGGEPTYISGVMASGELRSVEIGGEAYVAYEDLMTFREAHKLRAREGMKEIRRLGLMEERSIKEHHAARRGTSMHSGR